MRWATILFCCGRQGGRLSSKEKGKIELRFDKFNLPSAIPRDCAPPGELAPIAAFSSRRLGRMTRRMVDSKNPLPQVFQDNGRLEIVVRQGEALTSTPP